MKRHAVAVLQEKKVEYSRHQKTCAYLTPINLFWLLMAPYLLRTNSKIRRMLSRSHHCNFLLTLNRFNWAFGPCLKKKKSNKQKELVER
jgi:hypothetical protein